MFLVEMDVRLGFRGDPLSDDEITDLVEELIDELDHLPVEPSVGTVRLGDDIEMTIGVVVDKDDQFEALREGAAIIKLGLLKAIGTGAAASAFPRDDLLRSSVRVLEAA